MKIELNSKDIVELLIYAIEHRFNLPPKNLVGICVEKDGVSQIPQQIDVDIYNNWIEVISGDVSQMKQD